jgi:hypothetical protein
MQDSGVATVRERDVQSRLDRKQEDRRAAGGGRPLVGVEERRGRGRADLEACIVRSLIVKDGDVLPCRSSPAVEAAGANGPAPSPPPPRTEATETGAHPQPAPPPPPRTEAGDLRRVLGIGGP